MKKKKKYKKSPIRQAQGRQRIKEPVALIKCAFCKGKGLDPFRVPSKLSKCQTCKGTGKVYVPLPHERCPSCLGNGVYRHHRLTCSVCGGKGRVKKLSRSRTKGCKKENEEALDIETGLPCINAYELGGKDS